MGLMLAAISILLLSGLISLASRSRRSYRISAAMIVLGSLMGAVPVAQVLISGNSLSFSHSWQIPFASLSVGVDALSALFLIPIFLLSALGAIYGDSYLCAHGGKGAGRSPFFYGIMAASMAMVVMARNGMLFLISWEVMALSSYFLVTFDDEKEKVRKAGFTYLVATHIGTAFLLALFALMAVETGSMEFEQWRLSQSMLHSIGTLFILALVGFGTKAGFMPMHVWLPEAHPAAPSHVSALMSGVMIKTGIYGLLRMISILGAPPDWWGSLLIAIGAISGIMGVLSALAQHELKALLAYHSVENIGIIALGMGIGMLGISRGMPVVAAMGFAGCLLHVVNHALFKGLLFLGAGAVITATGTGEIDRQGGLLKRMPRTAASFLIGSAAISGLPPLNGFVSELLIYLGAFAMLAAPGVTIFGALPALVVIASLALIGGLASACFAKAFGTIFLGEPRSNAVSNAHEVSLSMRAPMAILAAGCIAVALSAPLLPYVLTHAVGIVSGGSQDSAALAGAVPVLKMLVALSAVLIGAAAVALIFRRTLLARREVRRAGTWDCGYAAPTARMQYTASSFAQPLTNSFRSLLHVQTHADPVEGFFPSKASFSSHARDLAREDVFEPLFASVASMLSRLRIIQHGDVHLYILYIAVALIALLAWTFGGQ